MPGMLNLARDIFQRREIVENWVSSLRSVFPGLLFRSLRVEEDVGCMSSCAEFAWG